MKKNVITFTRLADGSWGLLGPKSKLIEGKTVTVTKYDGSVDKVLVGSILWTGPKRALAAIGDTPPAELLAKKTVERMI